jgi:hypothetical protein
MRRAAPFLVLALAACLEEPAVRPWPGAAIRGFNVACWTPGCLDSAAAVRTFERARALGASDVALVVTWYVPDATQGAPAEDPMKSPALDEVERAVGRLRALGLSSIVKPHVDRLDGGSRTLIRPAVPDRWWAAYRDFVLAAADVAERSGARGLAAGTELGGLSGDASRWIGLVTDIRARYGGQVTYAANWDEVEGLRFLDALDWAGVDGYFPLSLGGVPTVIDGVEGWRAHLARLHRMDALHHRKILFTEVGAPSRDPAEQARSYRAALVSLRDEEGALFWNLWEGEDGGTFVATEAAQDTLGAAWPAGG